MPPEDPTPDDSGQWYKADWRRSVMETNEAQQTSINAHALLLAALDERLKAIERGGRWVLGIAGTLIAAGLIGLFTFLLHRP